MLTFNLGPEDGDRRIDTIIRKLFPYIPLSTIHKAIRQKKIRLGEKKAHIDSRGVPGESLHVYTSWDYNNSGITRSNKIILPSSIDTPFPQKPDILWEGNELLIISKPQGMVSHGQDGVDTWLTIYLNGKIRENLSFRPAPVHRLDRNTSGVLCCSKSLLGSRQGSLAFKEALLRKYYATIVSGKLSEPIIWRDNLERDEDRRITRITQNHALLSKDAVTEVWPVASREDRSLCIMIISTGKTHQIRAQAAAHGHCLIGDQKYGSLVHGGYYLHALALAAPERLGQIFPSFVQAPLPRRFYRRCQSDFGPDSPCSLSSMVEAQEAKWADPGGNSSGIV